jgi:polysaccharide biosynthesis protein PslG
MLSRLRGVPVAVLMQRGLVLIVVGVVLALPSQARSGMAEDAARLLELAQADTEWAAANSGDNLDYEASLAEPPGLSHHLVRGFNTRQQVDLSLGDVNRTMDELRATNFQIHRLMVYWADVQPNGPGEWRWAKYDAVVRSAAIRNIPLLIAPTGSPNWARVPDRRTDPANIWHPFPYPDDLGAWERFIYQLARRYARDAIAYHVWNEPNIKQFWLAPQHWTSRRLSPSAWTELYCRAAKRVRLADPSALVGAGGLGPITAQGVNWQVGRYLKRAYGVGIAKCGLDFAAIHPYLIRDYCDGKNPPMDELLPVIRQLRRMRGVMIVNGHSNRTIWNTEWGFPSSTCGFTEARQAELSARQDAYLASLPWMSHSIWFNPQDGPGTDRWAYIGVLRPDWTRKPVFGTLASLP